MFSHKIFFLIVIVLAVATAVFSQKAADKFASGEVLVKLSAGSSSGRATEGLKKRGAEAVEEFADLDWQRLKLPKGMSVEDAMKRFSSVPGVEAVQPNFYYHLLATPNDPQFSNAGMYGLGKISAPQAWDLTAGSPAVVVANIDTGVRYTHEDLAANMWKNPGEIPNNGIDDDSNGFVDDYYGYDFFFNDPDPVDENGHGTHTSGIIGAVGNNGVGVVGVNWNVRIMAIKIYDSDGFGTTSAMLINAYNYVRMMKDRGVNIRVTNNSYGGCDEACDYDQATKDALDAMGDEGILNVFAAGNEASNNDITPAYPASYTSPSIVAVANSNSSDAKNPGSNFGVESVDLAAPGTGILSTFNGSNSSYGTLTGTSMAAPHVTGAAALLSAYDQSLSAASLKASILNNVDTLPNWNGVVKTGGRLNVFKALQNPTVCTFGLSTQSVVAGTKGGYFSVDLNAQPNCDYSIKRNVNWIQISGQDVRSGSGTVTVRLTVITTITRTGTLFVAGQPVTIRQTRGENF
jgi:subtilisin family serine protease